MEEICSFCFDEAHDSRGIPKSKASVGPLNYSVCGQLWKPQSIAHTQSGKAVPIRRRPTGPEFGLYRQCQKEPPCPVGEKCPISYSEEELRHWFLGRVMEEPRLQPPQGVEPPYQMCKNVERNSYRPSIDVQCVSPHSKEELDAWKKTDQALLSTVESNQEAQKAMLLVFAPHMGYKEDFSGNQLQPGSLLQQLLSSPELGSQKMEHIMEEWALSATLVQVVQEHSGSSLQEVKAIALILIMFLMPESVTYGTQHSKRREEVNGHVLAFLTEETPGDQVQGVLTVSSEESVYPKMNDFASSILRKILQGVVARSSEPMDMVKQMAVHTSTYDPEVGRRTKFVDDIPVNTGGEKVVLRTSNSILPSLLLDLNLSIYFGQVGLGIMNERKEDFDSHYFVQDTKHFPVWGKGLSYSAVAVNLDVKKGYLRDDALKLLSLASSPELTEKEGLCINAPWYTGHCEQKSHFGLEMSAQIYRVEGSYTGYSTFGPMGTWVVASGAPVLTEYNEWTMCGVDCTELTGTDHTFADAALLTGTMVVDVYQGVVKRISNKPMGMMLQAVIYIDTYDPELCRGTKFTALLPVNSRRKKVVLRTYHNTFPSLSVYLNFSIHFGQVNGISLVNVSKGKECLDSHFVNDKHFPGEDRRFPCSAALLDVIRDCSTDAVLKGSNRYSVVPLLELIECIRLSALALIMLLLLQCGDVERNPGPVWRAIAEEVLQHFRDDFIKDMEADAVVLELLDKGIINGGDKNRIMRNEDPTQQNQILHLALKQACTAEALLTACGIIIAAGKPKMRALGENMKKMLTGTGSAVASATSGSDQKPAVKPDKQAPQSGDVLSHKINGYSNRLMLLREHVSRKAPGKEKALLEGLGLDRPQIEGCFGKHPLNEVEAVQDGLQGWIGEKDPTWRELLDAMEYARIGVQHCNELKKAISGTSPMVQAPLPSLTVDLKPESPVAAGVSVDISAGKSIMIEAPPPSPPTVNPEEAVDPVDIPTGYETSFSESCFMVGKINCLSVSATSEETVFTLGPGEEVSAKLIVPSGAIQGPNLHVKHAILLGGPFSMPEDLEIVSPVLYIDYDVSLVQKPLKLHLHHWYAGVDRQAMSILKASHVADEDGVFHFAEYCQAYLSDEEQFTVLELSENLCFITVAVRNTGALSCPCKCRLHLLKKEQHEAELFRLYATFDDPSWSKVIKEYIMKEQGWKKASYAAPPGCTLQSQEDGVKTELCPDSGDDWKITFEGRSEILLSQINDPVHNERKQLSSRLTEAIQNFMFHSPKPCKLIEVIQEELYPPSIHMELTGTERLNAKSTLKICTKYDDCKFSLTLHAGTSPMVQAPLPSPTVDLKPESPVAAGVSVDISAASQVLKKYEDEFIEVVDAKVNLPRLKCKNVVTESLITRIKGGDSSEAKDDLYEHLKTNATVDTLREYCKMISEANGYPKMQELGRKMLRELPPAHPISQWNIDALDSLKGTLKLRVSMSAGLRDKLPIAAGGCLNAEEVQQVTKLHSDGERIDEVIEILKKKTDKDFQMFLGMLRRTNQGAWASELEREAEEFKQRSEEYGRIVTEAIQRHGSVNIEVSKLVFLGPPEAGKTQLKRALMMDYENVTESTTLSTEQVVEQYVEKEGFTSTQWQRLTRKMLKEALQKSAEDECVKNERSLHTQPQSPYNPQVGDHDLISNSDQSESPPGDILQSSATKDPPAMREGLSPAYDHLRDEFVRLSGLVRSLPFTGAEEGLSMHYIRMIDNGGQPAFCAVHPVVATSRAIYVLVYNMQEGLNAKPKFTYRKKGCSGVVIENEHFTNLDLLMESLLTVVNLKEKFKGIEEKVVTHGRDSSQEFPVIPHSHLVVVGTRHEESCKEDLRAIEEQNNTLEEAFSAWKDDLLVYKDKNTHLFPVDSLNPDCPAVQAIRDKVSSKEFSLKLAIPISWFHCHLIFWSAREDRINSGKETPSELEVLPFSVLFKLCKDEGYISTEREMLAMIRAFHILGIFFFPALDQAWELKEDDPVVFTNPDLLLGELTKVFEVTFRNSDPSLQRLKKYGELTHGTMGDLKIPKEMGPIQDFDFQDFLLKQLSDWGLAARIPSEDAMQQQYFVPCILEPYKESELNREPYCEFESTKSVAASPTVCNSPCAIPNGSFDHLIVDLVGDQSDHKQMFKHRTNGKMYNDLVRLEWVKDSEVTETYFVTLRRKKNYFTVYIWRDNESETVDPFHWQTIFMKVKDMFQKACEHIYGKTFFARAVTECPCGNPKYNSHLAEFHHGKPRLSCLSTVSEVDISSEMESPLSRVLQVLADYSNQLMLMGQYVSRNAPGKGRALLEGLGLDIQQIESCFRKHPFDEEEVVQSGLKVWVDEKDPTWGDLLKAMEYANIDVQHCNELKRALSGACSPTDHEAFISETCFVVGKIQSLKLSASLEDSTFTLGPGQEGSAMLLVPSGAIAEGQDLLLKYAVLLDGPFSIPEDYGIVSPVLYINYDASLVKKPLELHLNDWYAGKDCQKTMSFLKAPHVANEDGLFPFTMHSHGTFSNDELIALLEPEQDLCLICKAVKYTAQSDFPTDCLLHLLQKTTDANTVNFRLYVTFANSAWIKVIKKYVIKKKAWTLVDYVGMHQITLHGENDAVYAGFDRCEDQDNGWKITLQGQTNGQITFQQLKREVSQYHHYTTQPTSRYQKIKKAMWRHCTNYVKEPLFPFIQFVLWYKFEPKYRTSRDLVQLKVWRTQDADDQPHLKFHLPVEIPGSRPLLRSLREPGTQGSYGTYGQQLPGYLGPGNSGFTRSNGLPGGLGPQGSDRPRGAIGFPAGKGGISAALSDVPRVSFAILTANKREQMAVNSYLTLGDPLNSSLFSHDCEWSSDAFLKAKKAKIERLDTYDGINYRVFSLEVGQYKTFGVHFCCDVYGPWGAFDKTVELLKIAKDKQWKLNGIFLVGCCGASVSEGKRKDYPRGTILLTNTIKDYLQTGKVETVASELLHTDEAGKCRIRGASEDYPLDKTWPTELETVFKTDTQGARNKIAVKKVNFFLSGPLVIKDNMFAEWFRGQDVEAAGVEMEGVGVIKGVKAIHDYEETPDKERPKIVLAKGISDYTGRKGEKATCTFFGEEIGQVDDDALQVYATLQSTALVVRFVVAKMQFFQYTS